MTKNITRLYSEVDLAKLYESKGYYDLTKDQIHYLIDVKRLKTGDQINLIDGRSGEFKCEIIQLSKKTAKLKINSLLNLANVPSDLTLLFSPLKRSRTDFIIEKCVELGIKTIIPIISDFTDIHNFNKKRNKRIMVSSAQQCGSTWMPNLLDLNKLENVLKDWDSDRILFFCDEKLKGDPILKVFQSLDPSPAAILVGPEGGFSKKETEFIDNFSFVKKVSLGKQILRAETAVVASVSIWQGYFGDWRKY
ncbi:MAG: 16S rRNA (uracil(1498)-N(3))-methyltransferase [Paracoccaceae bacterium]